MKKHNNELEIDEDITLEQRTWTFQRISWVILLLIILAALLGFTGRGGLPGINKLTASSASQSIKLEYDRFLRNEVTEELQVELQNLHNPTTSISFSKDFYEKLRVEQVVPEPEQVQATAENITYTFNTSQPESQIVFYTKPIKAGMVHITVSGPGNEKVTMSQFVYP